MNEAASEVLFQLCSENPRELVRLSADARVAKRNISAAATTLLQ